MDGPSVYGPTRFFPTIRCADAVRRPKYPRGVGASPFHPADESTMSSLFRKRRAATGEAEIGPGPCTRSNYYRNWRLMSPFPQQRKNVSSMRPRPCWISQTNHPMFSRLSNRAWEVSMPSSNTMKSVSVQSSTMLLTCLPPGIQRRRREPRRPRRMAHQVEGWYDDNQLRPKPSGGGETRAAHKVPITSLIVLSTRANHL